MEDFLNLPLVFNQDQLEANRNNINGFVLQYNDAFPDENEREKWELIEDRIIDANAYPRTFILFENFSDPNGGIVADIYHHIGVIHLIYIVVNKKQRRTGIATKLVKELLPKAILKIENEFRFNVSLVLFESNLPWLTTIDSFDPKTRLQIFEKLGAQHLPFD
jgi:GNAT superfamily N-acetyltransferase